ncbi:MAG: hypothetical protein AB2653_05155 [Candidatus Thiodiazotropha endolucinida]
MKRTTIAIILGMILSFSSYAQDNDATSIVMRGLEAYSKGGATAAVKSWIKDSGLEGSKEALSQANVLRQVEDSYGRYEGYEIIKDQEISDRVHMIIFAMNFNKGPMFGRFQSYRTKSGVWVATEFKFHTEAALVLPSNTVFGE